MRRWLPTADEAGTVATADLLRSLRRVDPPYFSAPVFGSDTRFRDFSEAALRMCTAYKYNRDLPKRIHLNKFVDSLR